MRYTLTRDLAGRSAAESGGCYFFQNLAGRSAAQSGGKSTEGKGDRILEKYGDFAPSALGN